MELGNIEKGKEYVSSVLPFRLFAVTPFRPRRCSSSCTLSLLVGPEKHANELAGRIPCLVLQNLRLVPLAFAGRTRQSQCWREGHRVGADVFPC